MATTWLNPPTFPALSVLTHTQLNTIGTDLIYCSESDNYEIGRASGDSTTSSTSFLDVTGASITINKVGKWLIFVDCNGNVSGGGDSGLFTISNAGVDDTTNTLYTNCTTKTTLSTVYLLTIASAPATIKIRYKALSGSIQYAAKGTVIQGWLMGP